MNKELAAFLKANLLFRNFSDTELRSVVGVAEERTIPSNTMVFAEESVGNALYMIRDGHVKVSKDVPDHGNLPLLVLGPGEFFGEMALVRPGPRLVTVKTLETSEFVIFSKEKWDALLETEPLVARKLTDLISNWFLLKLRRSNTEINRFIKWRLDQPNLESKY